MIEKNVDVRFIGFFSSEALQRYHRASSHLHDDDTDDGDDNGDGDDDGDLGSPPSPPLSCCPSQDCLLHIKTLFRKLPQKDRE